jgi:hypothetical protein
MLYWAALCFVIAIAAGVFAFRQDRREREAQVEQMAEYVRSRSPSRGHQGAGGALVGGRAGRPAAASTSAVRRRARDSESSRLSAMLVDGLKPRRG